MSDQFQARPGEHEGFPDEPVETTAVPGGPGGPSGADDGGAQAGEPDAITELTRQRDDYLDALQRLKAEFDNFRKRVAREEALLSARASERLVKKLIPMLDDLQRAVDAAAEHGETSVADGVRLVHRGLATMLTQEGLVEVETDGLFDPHTQEALLTQPSEAPEGTVIEVLQKGFRLGDHVLRPARVVVSSGTPATAGGA